MRLYLLWLFITGNMRLCTHSIMVHVSSLNIKRKVSDTNSMVPRARTSINITILAFRELFMTHEWCPQIKVTKQFCESIPERRKKLQTCSLPLLLSVTCTTCTVYTVAMVTRLCLCIVAKDIWYVSGTLALLPQYNLIIIVDWSSIMPWSGHTVKDRQANKGCSKRG